MPDAGRAERGDERPALVRSRRANRWRGGVAVHAQLAARLGVDEAKLADVRELLLARVADLDRKHGVPSGKPKQRRAPVGRATKVGDENDECALAHDAVGQFERLAQPACAARRKRAEQLERVQQRAAPLPRRLDRRALPERDRAEAVAALGRGIPDRDRDAFRDIGLAPVGRAERHRGGRIEDEPGDEDALGQLDPHVRLAGAGSHVPFDPAHVVTLLVDAHLPQLAAEPANAER
jgi:hypothetical protein